MIFFFDRKPFSDSAAKIFTLCELNKIKGYVTPVIISNVYYLLRQNALHEKVIEKLFQLLTFTNVLTMDKKVVFLALNSHFKDFEDTFQNYAAESFGRIDLILTRNTKDYKNSLLKVMSPESYLQIKFAAIND